MSWTQEHSVPSLADLYEKITGEALDTESLIKKELRLKGFSISEEKQILLYDGDIYLPDVYGKEYVVRSLDANDFEIEKKTYVPKLVEQHTANGNYGLDIYEWKEKEDTNVKVIRTNDEETIKD